MFYIIPKLETFLFANHEAQSIYGYQSLTSYCDMKSANLDLSNRALLDVPLNLPGHRLSLHI